MGVGAAVGEASAVTCEDVGAVVAAGSFWLVHPVSARAAVTAATGMSRLRSEIEAQERGEENIVIP